VQPRLLWNGNLGRFLAKGQQGRRFRKVSQSLKLLLLVFSAIDFDCDKVEANSGIAGLRGVVSECRTCYLKSVLEVHSNMPCLLGP
jgi:hypothetical protein